MLSKRKRSENGEIGATNKQLRTYLSMLDDETLRTAVTRKTLEKVEQMFKRRDFSSAVVHALICDTSEPPSPHELLYAVASVGDYANGDFKAFVALYMQTKKDLQETGKSQPKCNVFVNLSAVDVHADEQDDSFCGAKLSMLPYFVDKDKWGSLRNNFIALCAEKLGSAQVVDNLLMYYDWFYTVN